jgi:hypothetical protein
MVNVGVCLDVFCISEGACPGVTQRVEEYLGVSQVMCSLYHKKSYNL